MLPFSHFWRIHANLSFTTLCVGCICGNFDCKFHYDIIVLFPCSEDQKHSFLGMESAKIEKITQKNVFFQKIFGHMRATPSHLATLLYLRTPPVGNSERIFPTFPRSYGRKMQPMPSFLPQNTLFFKKNAFFCKNIWSCPFFVVPLHSLSKRKCF